MDFADLPNPFDTYIFRLALINTGKLWLATYAISLLLGWAWANVGVPPRARFLLLLPLFIPGALVGLLWRPYLAPWLDLASADLSLILIATVTLWGAVPMAAWLHCNQQRAWITHIPLCAFLILFNGDFILTFTRGEPFNAMHTWPSWIISQLWVNRAWDSALSMLLLLALVLAVLIGWIIWSVKTNPPHEAISYGSPLGLIIMLLWIGGPFAWPLLATIQAPVMAISALINLGAMRWLLNGALLWLAITGIALIFIRSLALAAGIAALIIAHIFPLQLFVQLPPQAWTPTQGIVWTLAEAQKSTAALGMALLLAGAWAGSGAWMLARKG